jgi:signal transduction histidine kinase
LTPFIFLTAKAGGVDVRAGMGCGADDYITKPFDPGSLLASVRQRLKHRRLQLQEAERCAAGSSMQAAAALPREMQGSLSHLDRISDYFTARYQSDQQARQMSTAMKDEVARLRAMSERLRLYGELPGLYARRFSAIEEAASCPIALAAETAGRVARRWGREEDLRVYSGEGPAPLTTESLSLLTTELVDNAFKFSETRSPVSIHAGPEDAYWKLSVSDKGIGLTPAQVEEIGAFKQFWSGSDRPSGLGLGLVLVQSVSRLHAGEVLMESEPGAGTTVTVMIPSE